MKNPWPLWVGWLDHREAATSLALCRIVVCMTLVSHLLIIWGTGVVSAVWVDVRFGGMRNSDLDWLEPFGGATPSNVRLLMLLAIGSATLMGVGLFTRVTAVLTWLSFRTLSGLNDQTGGSSDDVLINALFILMFSSCGSALSLDSRGRPPAEVPAWPRYLLIGQLVAVYWFTGLQKVSAGWLPVGPLDALWYIFQQPTWQRIPMEWLAPAYRLTQLGTFITWCFEWFAPLLLLAFWYRHTRERPGKVRAFFNRLDFRTLYLALGVTLHFGILVTLEVGPFLGGMFSLYMCCFTPDEWKAVAAKVRERFKRQFQFRHSAS